MLAGIIFIILTIGVVAPIIIAIVAYIVAIIDNATKDERQMKGEDVSSISFISHLLITQKFLNYYI